MKRVIKINGINKELELSKAVSVKTNKQMIHLDQLSDGSWRLIYNSELIPDFTKVKNFEIIRKD
jgi:hypothetical protein